MQSSSINRRDFLKFSAVTGTAALLAASLPKFSLAQVRAVKLVEVLEMSPEEMAKKSKMVMDSWDYLQMSVATIKDQKVRGTVSEILANPAPTFVEPIYSGAAKEQVWQELKGKGFLQDVPQDQFLPQTDNSQQSPQPFHSAPGSGYQSHHAYPGGVVTHTALNVKSSLAIYEGYRETYGYELDRDVVIASQVLHDLHKPWVFQWGEDGASRTELGLAGTGEHHPYSVAESIYRGLPAEICVAQACAHNHPGSPKDEKDPVSWINSACILLGVDPKQKGLLDSSGETLPQPRRMENFVCHLGDHDWVLTVPAAKWLIPVMQSIAVEKYGLTEQDLQGKKFNAFRNYVFSQATIMALYQLYSTKGKEALTETVTSIVIPS